MRSNFSTKCLIRFAGFACLLAAVYSTAPSAGIAQPMAKYDSTSGRVILTNGRLELMIETQSGINPRVLHDVVSGHTYADRDYAWGDCGLPKMDGPPVITNHPDGNCSVELKGQIGSIIVQQVFTAPSTEPGVILEQITISNPSENAVETADFKCGFAKCIREGEIWTPDAAGIRFCPIPYRRETDGQLQEFSLREVAERGTTFSGWAEPQQPTPIWGAEGWVWSHSSPLALGEGEEARANTRGNAPRTNPLPKGEKAAAFLIAKYNPEGMEWSLMEPIIRGTETLIRFGGMGQWKHGHPEASTRLAPGGSYCFGQTRLQAVVGDWKQGYYAYRRWIESKGCTTPKDYNPPVHWNELYDNEYFFKVGAALGDEKTWYTPGFNENNKNLLAEFYSKDLILSEAAKAKDLGCEALYLDPGWDTGPSHHVWDAMRLGSMESFVKKLQQEYGLKVSLWIGTGGMPPTYADPDACPPEAQVVDKNGRRTNIHCFACPAFLDTKEKRLLELCKHGVAFLMFDSTQYSGPCYDKTHGHSIPSSREEHAKALLELVRRVKSQFPRVLIEMHDPISGPGGYHYTPTYYGYARPHSFDCLWGHEFMWNSMDDLLSRRAVSLYYYNLAYSIPLYLHVGLKTDNENALVFWWFASTCRHLGVGGKHDNPAVWSAHKNAMQTYLALKRYYTQGTFYGIEEMVHAHTLSDLKASVINIFNLEDKPVQKTIEFCLDDIGLPAGVVKIKGVDFQQDGNKIILNLEIPGRGQRLFEVQTALPERL